MARFTLEEALIICMVKRDIEGLPQVEEDILNEAETILSEEAKDIVKYYSEMKEVK